jgi:hypothetical protein
LLTDLGGESKGNEPQRVQAYIPPQNPKEEGLKIASKKSPRKAPKITKKEKWERHIQGLRNHVESSIPTKELHTRCSLPPDDPSLSHDLTMKLSIQSYKTPRENRKEK